MDGVVVRDTRSIAETLNKFYVDSVNEISRSIHCSRGGELIANPSAQMSFELRRIEASCLLKCLREMPNKKDVDFISRTILMDAWPILANTVHNLINQSLNSTMPNAWKNATVVPVAKVPRPEHAESGGLSSRQHVYDIREAHRNGSEELVDSIRRDKQLAVEVQSAYRDFVLMKWKELHSSGDIILAVFLDLKRAFETIDRTRLVVKLTKVGFSSKTVSWFEGYLRNRNQKTKDNGHESNSVQNNLGDPQGSVLGAILFNVSVVNKLTVDEEPIEMVKDIKYIGALIDTYQHLANNQHSRLD